MAKKAQQKTDSKSASLCVLHETKKIKAELFKDGDAFRVSFGKRGGKERHFDSLPSLMQGLHGIFLELRMSGPGLRGLDALARASDDARQDVLAASRKIHAALETD